MIKHQERVNQLEIASAESSHASHPPTLEKATKTLEKSTRTFKNAVDVGMTLIGTGSVKAPLLLPTGTVTTPPQVGMSQSESSSSS